MSLFKFVTSDHKQLDDASVLFNSKLIHVLVNLCSPGSAESVEQVMDQVEKFIMTRLYKSVFCPETTDDEKKDLATQGRIRQVSITFSKTL